MCQWAAHFRASGRQTRQAKSRNAARWGESASSACPPGAARRSALTLRDCVSIVGCMGEETSAPLVITTPAAAGRRPRSERAFPACQRDARRRGLRGGLRGWLPGMRIAYVIPAFPPAPSQPFVVNEMIEVQEAGHEVFVVPLYRGATALR